MSTILAALQALFAKTKNDVEAEVASPNFSALHTIAFVALILFLLYYSKTLVFNQVSEGYVVHSAWVFMITHTAYKLGIAFINAWKGTSVHGDKASVAVAATSPATGAVPIVPPATLPAKT